MGEPARDYVKYRNLQRMDGAKAVKSVCFVAITTTPNSFNLGVRTQVNHTKSTKAGKNMPAFKKLTQTNYLKVTNKSLTPLSVLQIKLYSKGRDFGRSLPARVKVISIPGFDPGIRLYPKRHLPRFEV